GLGLLQTLPETPERVQREVDMLIALGVSLRATKGHAALEVEQSYLRAQHLCQSLNDPHQLFPVLHGLWNAYLVRAEYQTAHTLGEQLLTLAQQAQNPVMLVVARNALGATLFHLGAAASAHTHFAQGIALYDPQQHRASSFLYAFLYGDNAGILCRSSDAWALWCLGYPDQGLARSVEAVTLARQIAYPISLGFVLGFAALFHQFRREMPAAQEYAESAVSLATEQGFPPWMAGGAMLRGWALAQQGQAKEGIEQLNQGLMGRRAMGAEIFRPYWLALLAEAH